MTFSHWMRYVIVKNFISLIHQSVQFLLFPYFIYRILANYHGMNLVPEREKKYTNSTFLRILSMKQKNEHGLLFDGAYKIKLASTHDLSLDLYIYMYKFILFLCCVIFFVRLKECSFFYLLFSSPTLM